MTQAEKLANELSTAQGISGKRVCCFIRAKRELLGISVKQLAKHFGVGIQTIYQMEYGHYTPSFEWLRKLEDFFGCSHRELWEPLARPNTTPDQPQGN